MILHMKTKEKLQQYMHIDSKKLNNRRNTKIKEEQVIDYPNPTMISRRHNLQR